MMSCDEPWLVRRCVKAPAMCSAGKSEACLSVHIAGQNDCLSVKRHMSVLHYLPQFQPDD